MLQVGTNPVVNVTLTVGNLGETVTVVGNAAMVETQSTGVGQVIDHQRVTELPLNGRQVTELIFLSGLAASAPPADLNTNKNFPTTTISVAGGQANGISFIMDGATHNDPFNNLNLPTPFPDAIQEFKVETSALPARYGHHAASTVNVVTQSGSNKVTADVFEFLRNYRFNARNFFAPARDSLNRNQFGGTLGAPIMKNRLFFFGGYQGRIERSNPVDALGLRPHPGHAQRRLHGLRLARLQRRAPGQPRRALRQQSRRPLALEQRRHELPEVRSRRQRPLRLASLRDPEQQHRAPGDRPSSTTPSTTTRARSCATSTPCTTTPRPTTARTSSPCRRTGQNNQAHSVVGAHNWALSPTTFNALHVTFNRTLNDRALPEYFTPTELGSNIASPYPGYTGVTVTGNGFSVGFGAVNPGYFDSKSLQVADDLDFIRGKHQISFGGNWIHTQHRDEQQPAHERGSSRSMARRRASRLADFMVGSISGGFLQGNPVFDYDHHDYIAAYVQDSWRAAPESPAQPRPPLGAVPSHPEYVRVGDPLRQGGVRPGTAQHGLSPGPRRPDLPRRPRVPRQRHDLRQGRELCSARRPGVDARE